MEKHGHPHATDDVLAIELAYDDDEDNSGYLLRYVALNATFTCSVENQTIGR